MFGIPKLKIDGLAFQDRGMMGCVLNGARVSGIQNTWPEARTGVILSEDRSVGRARTICENVLEERSAFRIELQSQPKCTSLVDFHIDLCRVIRKSCRST